MTPYKIGILGATGMVGQRLVQLLEGHPWFELTAVAASPASTGRHYAEAVHWSLNSEMPRGIARKVLRQCRTDEFSDCDLVLSGLPVAAGREIEGGFAEAGFAVISNCSAFRGQANVPVLIPELNTDHLCLIDEQRRKQNGGYIVTNPNCSVTGLALVVAPLHRAFGIKQLVVTTMQAISGAGTNGPRALALADNIVPYIAGEEEKLESELTKILGTAQADGVTLPEMTVSAHCHRVATTEGHLEAVSVSFQEPVSPDRVEQTLLAFGETAALGLPSAPRPVIRLRAEVDRPQPRLDRDCGNGMAVVVGRIRKCSVLGVKFELLSHNTIRGAAGGTLLNAELLAERNLLPRRSNS